MRWGTLMEPELAVAAMVERYSGIVKTTLERPVRAASGYVLAEDLYSRIDVPGFDRSTKDGYAVCAGDTHAVLTAEVMMGEAPGFTLAPGQCAAIPTGGALPEGALGVVMIENAQMDGDTVSWNRPVEPFENCVQKGQDVATGMRILSAGTVIGAKEVGVMAAVGLRHVKVFRPPAVTLISTGDEIVETVEDLRFGKVLDINSHTLRILMEETGLEVLQVRLVNDTRDALLQAVKEAVAVSDIVVVSGGSSVGKKDHTASVFNAMGEPGVFLHGVRIKPGKPTLAALANETLLLGLPGHPVSAMVVYYEIVEPVLRAVFGIRGLKVRTEPVELGENLFLSDGRETHVMVHLVDGKAYRVEGESGLIRMIAQADGKIVVPLGTSGLMKGAQVMMRRF